MDICVDERLGALQPDHGFATDRTPSDPRQQPFGKHGTPTARAVVATSSAYVAVVLATEQFR
jgi:hypothetical protein